MLDKGVKVNDVMKDGWMFLMEVVDEGYMDIVKFFLDKGVKVNVIIKVGYMFLMVVVDEGYGEIVKLLI